MVRAKPSAKEDKVEKTGDNFFTVSCKEPPVKGLANAAIAKQLADYFGVPAFSVRLVTGFTSRQKVFEIKESNDQKR